MHPGLGKNQFDKLMGCIFLKKTILEALLSFFLGNQSLDWQSSEFSCALNLKFHPQPSWNTSTTLDVDFWCSSHCFKFACHCQACTCHVKGCQPWKACIFKSYVKLAHWQSYGSFQFETAMKACISKQLRLPKWNSHWRLTYVKAMPGL